MKTIKDWTNYKFWNLRHKQSTEIWMDRKKATIVPDDEDRVITGDFGTIKWNGYMYIVRKYSINVLKLMK